MEHVRVAVKAAIVREHELLILYKSDHGAEGDPDPSHRRDLPGGRLEFGEVPQQGLLREVSEETGLCVEVVTPCYVWHYVKPAEKFQLIGVTFACRYISGIVQLSEEHSNYEWLTQQQVHEKGWPESDEYISALNVFTLKAAS